MILSASRRTDIPGYYSEWFMNRLKEGYVLTRNPMNRSQVGRVYLSPENIDCIVFWTKDPVNMMDKLKQLDSMKYSYYFQFTLTPYGRELERNLRNKNDIIDTFIQLSKAIGKDRVLWRYDPILLNKEITFDYHMREFEKLCQKLQGYTNICTISFVDIYSKLCRPVRDNLIAEIPEDEMHRIASGLSDIAAGFGIELRACCEITDFTRDTITSAACIDKNVVERVCGHSIAAKRDKNQRTGCNCIESIDIGAYNTCKNGCIYCYANHSDTSINNNFMKHNPKSGILIGSVADHEKITDRNEPLKTKERRI